MVGLTKSNLRNLISGYFNWRYPVLIIFLGVGVVLFLAGVVLFKHQLSSVNSVLRNKLTPAVSTENSNENSLIQETITYQVKPGDTLWELADLFYGDNNLYPQLAKVNKLQPDAKLMVGQQLIIPYLAELVGEENTTSLAVFDLDSQASDSTIASTSTTTNTYQVRSGDTLWDIAEAELGDPLLWPQLYEANQTVIGGNPNLIFPGQVLLL